MISVVIPTYKEPEALDICLKSAIEGQKNKQEAVKIATITKEIEPSKETTDQVFFESAKFEESVRNGDFTKI